jgi:hypothetical protein
MSGITTAEEFESVSLDALIDRLLAENAAAAKRGTVCITCSFQAEDMIVLDTISRKRMHIGTAWLRPGT